MGRRSPVRGGQWCAIGAERPKTAANLGSLFRSAVCLRADMIFTVADRYYEPACTDTVKAWTHVPYFRYSDLDDFADHRPYDTPVVGVELTDDAEPLERFTHPRRAVYLLGPEDGSLSKAALSVCTHVVKVDTAYCLNQAMAGTVVLYDRHMKAGA